MIGCPYYTDDIKGFLLKVENAFPEDKVHIDSINHMLEQFSIQHKEISQRLNKALESTGLLDYTPNNTPHQKHQT